MSTVKRLARAIHKSGSTDPESIARYLAEKGWTDRAVTVTQCSSSIAGIPSVMVTPKTKMRKS